MYLANWASYVDWECARDGEWDIYYPVGVIVPELTDAIIKKLQQKAHDEWAEMEDVAKLSPLKWKTELDEPEYKVFIAFYGNDDAEEYGRLIIQKASVVT